MTQPNSADVAFAAVKTALEAGNAAHAADLLEALLRTHPSSEGFRNLAILRLQMNQREAARIACERTVALNPTDASAHGLMGDVLFRQEQLDLAAEAYERATGLAPTFKQAWVNLTITHIRRNAPDLALRAWQHATDLGARSIDIACGLSDVLRRHAKAEHAFALLSQEIAAEPRSAPLRRTLGVVLHKLGRDLEALGQLDIAERLDPTDAEIAYSRGVILTAIGRFDEAIAAYRQAMSYKPGHIEARWNLALVLLRVGRWTEAWPHFESRLLRPSHKKRPAPIEALPRWRGEPTKTREKILLLAEQGLGDTLMFCRYAAEVARLGWSVSILAPEPLRGLLSRVEGVERVETEDVETTNFRCRIELMSLPGLFGTTEATIPSSESAYLNADTACVDLWRDRLRSKTAPKIGLMWRGRTNPSLSERSLSLEMLAAHLPRGPSYVSLQREVLPEEMAAADTLKLDTHNGLEIDFEDAAALIELMDQVITIDTSIAHLSAGMDKPTWVVLPAHPEWRWGDSADRSLWYRATRLFRADQTRGWTSALSAIAQQIART